ncbi:9833_t:CDS:2, partial [Ambispora gerdemannii]
MNSIHDSATELVVCQNLPDEYDFIVNQRNFNGRQYVNYSLELFNSIDPASTGITTAILT